MIVARREHRVYLKLPSRERVLVSVAEPGVKISKLSFGGMISTKTICNWSAQPGTKGEIASLDQAMRYFMSSGPNTGRLADIIAAGIMRECKSIDDIRKLCASIART